VKASFDASGEVVLVTGGAQGIGAAIATACADAGAQVVVLDTAAGPGHPGVQEVRVDVADRDAVTGAAAEVVRQHGRIDGLVAGAAVQPRTPVLETSPEQWRRVLAVNLDGVVWVCQAVVAQMVRQRRGAVVLFTSGLAASGFPGAAGYAASKAALVGFAKSLAAEVAADRIRVNVVSPGVVDTAQFRAANAGADLDHWRRTTGIGTPADVVGPLLFLLSDAATMTGSLLTRERAYPAEVDR
jgi:NAD(P)-dependent dehydrogenase (short-subunit alcohol dehydrogenase family)